MPHRPPAPPLIHRGPALAALLAALCLLANPSATRAADSLAFDWPRWRGPHDQGSASRGTYPSSLDASKPRWKTALPGKGCSTPAVHGDRIYLTAPARGLDAVLAVSRRQGEVLWTATFGTENPGKHRNGSGSNPSPAVDEHGLYVWFKSGTLAALDFDGRVRWQTNLVERFGKDTLFWDHGTSPVPTRDGVVVARMHHGESWLVSFDKATGRMLWKADRNYQTPTECDNSYTTPIVIRHHDREALLVWGAQHLTAHDSTDGSVLWSCGDFNPGAKEYWPAVASPVVIGDLAIVPYGRSDRGSPRLHAVRLGGKGDVTASHRVWLRDDTGTFVPTPAAYRDRVYLLRDRGEVECLDPATGKTLWKDALPRSGASYYASPLIAAGRLYAAREDGVVFVADVEPTFSLRSENNLGERVVASPVPLGDGLLIRGEQHLFCLTGK